LPAPIRASARNIISIRMNYLSALVRRPMTLAILAVTLFCVCGIAGWAQSDNQFAPAPPGDASSRSGAQRSRDEDVWIAQQKRDMAKKRNLQRQEDIKKDTDKLLSLATELKQYVDKTNENTLSVEVIKKAEEIEKLAHTVKEKMKGP
jgi:hypothetical protein